MPNQFVAFIRDDGANAVAEYAICLATIAAAMLGTLTLIMSESTTQLSGTQSRMTNTALTPP